MPVLHRSLLALALACCLPAATAAVTVVDDHQRDVTLASPARRAIALAPHAVELVYAAGAGQYLAGTVRGADYPPAARELPIVGDGTMPDAERVAAMKPDLLIAWQSAATEPMARVMQKLKVPVYYSDPQTLAAIPDEVERLGVLFGTQEQAQPTAAAMRARLTELAARYGARKPVRVFIQAGLDPTFTLNNSSIVGDAVRLCGGVNVFGDAPIVAPQVSMEGVLAARPDAVLAGVARASDTEKYLRAWQSRNLPAAMKGHVFGIDADALYRPGPRLIDATAQLCAALDSLRS